MKTALVVLLIVLMKLPVAQACLLFSASFSPNLCGPYPYKQLDNGTVLYLPIFKQNAVSHGFKILEEEGRLSNFLWNWINFFVNNGDNNLQFNSVCYGFFDDTNSTGPNALAYGKKAILIGTGMMKLIRDDIDKFVSTKIAQWNPNDQAYIRGLKSTAALDFLLLHEFAHHLQNMHNYKFSGPTMKMKELHADCVGAALFSLSKIVHNSLTSQDALAGMLYAYALGDGNTSSIHHHGFPEERMDAFTKGMAYMINMRNMGVDLSKYNSKQVIEACRMYYR